MDADTGRQLHTAGAVPNFRDSPWPTIVLVVAALLVVSPGYASTKKMPARTHLYVTDYAAGVVMRFPVDSHGLARTTSDGAITGIDSPSRIAVDQSGTLYVVTGAYGSNIEIFPPGSNGSVSPSRTINLPPQYKNLFEIAVDTNGFTYVSAGVYGDQILVYSPTASGNATPTNVLSGNRSLEWGLAVTSNTTLYALTQLGILTYSNPLHETSFDAVILPHPYEHLFFQTMTLSTKGNQLWVHYEPKDVFDRWQLTDYVSLDLPGLRHDPHIEAGDCRAGFMSGFQVGSAANANYLYVSCGDTRPNAVFVYKTIGGRERPVETLTDGLVAPEGIALGP